MINKNKSIMPDITNPNGIIIHKVKPYLIIVNEIIVMKSFPDIESNLLKLHANWGFLFQLFRDNEIIVMKYADKSIKESVTNGYDPFVAGYKVGTLLRRCHDIIKVPIEKSKIMENRKIKSMIKSKLLSVRIF